MAAKSYRSGISWRNRHSASGVMVKGFRVKLSFTARGCNPAGNSDPSEQGVLDCLDYFVSISLESPFVVFIWAIVTFMLMLVPNIGLSP
jgi:hypothetical protein